MSLSTRTRSQGLVYGATPRVNLLPPLERQRRERSVLIRRWGAGAIAAVVLVGVAVMLAAWQEHAAGDDLQAERTRTTTLAGQVAAYRDVSAATRDKGAYEAYRAQAMSSDVSWKSVLGALQAGLPSGVSITGFEAVVASEAPTPPAAQGESVPALPAPSGTTVTATVQVTSMQPLNQTAMIGSFGKVPGVVGVDLVSLTSTSSVSYSSTTTVYFDRSVLSGTYAKAAQ